MEQHTNTDIHQSMLQLPPLPISLQQQETFIPPQQVQNVDDALSLEMYRQIFAACTRFSEKVTQILKNHGVGSTSKEEQNASATNPAPCSPRARKRKKKAKKDETVKRPLSSYMLFVEEHRQEIKAKNPNISFTDLGRALGHKWQKLEEEDKKRYRDAAEFARQNFQAQQSQTMQDPIYQSTDRVGFL